MQLKSWVFLYVPLQAFLIPIEELRKVPGTFTKQNFLTSTLPLNTDLLFYHLN